MFGNKLIQAALSSHLSGRSAWDLYGLRMKTSGAPVRAPGSASQGPGGRGAQERLVHATSRPAQWSVAADLGCVPSTCAEVYGIAEEAGVGTRTLARPKMRGLLRAAIQFHLAVGFLLAALGGLAFKVFVADVRKQRYADFYRNYDAQKEFEVMRKKGLFQSC